MLLFSYPKTLCSLNIISKVIYSHSLLFSIGKILLFDWSILCHASVMIINTFIYALQGFRVQAFHSHLQMQFTQNKGEILPKNISTMRHLNYVSTTSFAKWQRLSYSKTQTVFFPQGKWLNVSLIRIKFYKQFVRIIFTKVLRFSNISFSEVAYFCLSFSMEGRSVMNLLRFAQVFL